MALHETKAYIASVVIDRGFGQALDYGIREDLRALVRVGTRVAVPLSTRSCKGTIIALKNTTPYKASLRDLENVLDEPSFLTENQLHLAEWISSYYGGPLDKILRLFLPPPIRKGMGAKEQLFVTSLLSGPKLIDLCLKLRASQDKKAEVIDILLQHQKGILLTELLEQSKCSRAIVKALEKEHILELRPLAIERDPLFSATFVRTKVKTLHEEQEKALSKIVDTLDRKHFAVHLLHGITGSGKTEIYLQAIDKALQQEKSILFLVPEVILTSQTIERLKGRFSEKIALFHHRLSDGEKRDAWYALETGTAKIAVGARSVVFAPLKNLGLIIVDEEHEPSYKQTSETPCYHGRDVAIMRAKYVQATVILGSATPSLESYRNALDGKYILSSLSTRAASSFLPEVQIIDMRREAPKHKGSSLFSDALLREIETRWKQGEQSLLFLNRRGYYTFRLCKNCGTTEKCPHCDTSLTYYRKNPRFSCHLCGYEIPSPQESCSFCKQKETMHYKGFGTEQVERALHLIFPDIRTLRLDGDTTKHKGRQEELFKQFRSGKADVLIGTQMIAKGLHIPSITLVGVLSIDGALNIPDFRASERVFQLLTQVSGRAGRGALKGKVLLQTYQVDNSTILHAKKHDYPSFYKEEIESRKLFGYPPFNRLVKILGEAEQSKHVEESLHILRTHLEMHLPPTYELEPIMPCNHAKIKNAFRWQFLIKGPSCSLAIKHIHEKIGSLKGKKVRLLIDSDPISILS